MESFCCIQVAKCWGCRGFQNGIAVVTGANRGIGFATAKILLQQGNDVHLLCRSKALGEDAARRLVSYTGNGRCKAYVVDLEDLTSIRAYLKVVEKNKLAVKYLINNAGLIGPTAMDVNHLGHFALTVGLASALRRGASLRFGGVVSVVNVASVAHVQGSLTIRSEIEKMERFCADSAVVEQRVDDWELYSASKTANVMFSFGLARRINARKCKTRFPIRVSRCNITPVA